MHVMRAPQPFYERPAVRCLGKLGPACRPSKRYQAKPPQKGPACHYPLFTWQLPMKGSSERPGPIRHFFSKMIWWVTYGPSTCTCRGCGHGKRPSPLEPLERQQACERNVCLVRGLCQLCCHRDTRMHSRGLFDSSSLRIFRVLILFSG